MLRDDAGWADAAQAYARTKRASGVADAALAQARDALVVRANHPREQGAGVAVTRYWKAGNINFAKIPALQGLDLSSYRAKAREEVKVTAAS